MTVISSDNNHLHLTTTCTLTFADALAIVSGTQATNETAQQ